MRMFAIVLFVFLFSSQMVFAEAQWADKLNFGGDFRYRHEYADQEQTDAANHKNRLRARLKMDAEVNEQTHFILQLASGGNSATSTNQTLDDGYTNKAIDIDMAYVNWVASKSTQVLLGKVKNTLYSPGESELLFDSDLTPEGVTLNWSCNCENSNGYFLNLGSYWLDERNADETATAESDTMQYSAQAGVSLLVGENKLTAGLGHHAFSPIEGRVPFAAGGNTLNGLLYAQEFMISELFLVFDVNASENSIQLYGQMVSNAGASQENQAYILGLNYGKAKEVGQWSLGYNYRVVEADAVLSEIDDGDFAKGDTDSKGHKVQYKYQMAKNVQGSFSYIKSERAVELGTKVDYDLAQVDLVFKF